MEWLLHEGFCDILYSSRPEYNGKSVFAALAIQHILQVEFVGKKLICVRSAFWLSVHEELIE
jgi:hypothetical protein